MTFRTHFSIELFNQNFQLFGLMVTDMKPIDTSIVGSISANNIIVKKLCMHAYKSYVYIYIHACMHAGMRACMHACIYVYIIFVYIYTCMHACMHIFMHTCMMYTCMHNNACIACMSKC